MSTPPPPIKDDFFVGYEGRLPTAIAAWVRGVAAVLLLAVPLVVAMAAAGQQRADEGTYEFGIVKTFDGVVSLAPVPMLRGVADETGVPRDHLLVGALKSGAPSRLAEFDGKRVKLDGSLIHRRGQAMIEVLDPATIVAVEGDAAAVGPQALGTMTLRGELLDTKCFLGAMRPAVGKVHRGCATVCLKSGIPAGLRVVDGDGHEALVLLAGLPGQRLSVDYRLAGTMIEATGEVERVGDFTVMRVSSYTRR